MALSEADYWDLLDIEAIRAVCGRGHAGSVRLLSALERHEPRLAYSRSRLERKFIALCRRYGLPLPEINAKIGLMTVDALYRAQRVVVELDGHRGHRSPAQLSRDRRRELHCRRLGFTVLRYTEDQIDNEPELVAADLARELGLSCSALSA
jgi:very-short-patch-repair endonuclease